MPRCSATSIGSSRRSRGSGSGRTSLPRIESWDRSDEKVARPPKGVTHVVLDTPAGIHGHALKDALKIADRLIIPLQPSLFDIYATQAFLGRLAERGLMKDGGRVGVLGMRVDARTRAAEQLQRFVEQLGLPVLGFLRDTQNYVQLAAHGLTLWDVAPSRVAKDLEQWQSLLEWVSADRYLALTANSREATVDDLLLALRVKRHQQRKPIGCRHLELQFADESSAAAFHRRQLVDNQSSLGVLRHETDQPALGRAPCTRR